MGDFYELFHDDAITAAPLLDIVLTSRNKKSEDDTPMCGVPHHSIAGPINKLLSKGYKVAICDQLEDPKQAKGIVKRGVTRILSPGMVYDPDNLEGTALNYIASFDEKSVSYLEPTTGECFYFITTSEKVRENIFELIPPVELVLTEEQKKEFLEKKKTLKGPHLSVFESTKDNNNQSLPFSAHRLLAYASVMQGEEILSTLKSFEERQLHTRLKISPTVFKHLEIFETYVSQKEGSLFYAIDRTKSSAGARVLKQWLTLPLAREKEILFRQEKIQSWVERYRDLQDTRQILSKMGDIERRLGKISNPNCNPRDLLAISESLEVGIALTPFLNKDPRTFVPQQFIEDLKTAEMLTKKIRSTLVEEPPLSKKEGGLIQKGYCEELDELIELSSDGQTKLLELEQKEKEATGISSLKIRYNNVFGYYIEVTHTHKSKVPTHYLRKQTLVNAERYVTEELIELEKKILSARAKREQLEFEIFESLRKDILIKTRSLLFLSRFWAEVDVFTALAFLAIERKYVRPQFNTEGKIELVSSRHPVIEQIIKSSFIPNDLYLLKGETLLLTGPNMAGKSTLMRQVALSVILAQMGSFVPAREARLPLFEQLFTRIGASDALTEGLSTFMVEMVETAEILKEASDNALIIMDEIGRGTSTYDGMSLAQSILEYLSKNNRYHVYFATHYHELTELENTHPRIRNAHMSIREKNGDLFFLYTLTPGPTNRSYGIEVARRAGLPDEVVTRAKSVLKERETQHITPEQSDQMSLFSFSKSQKQSLEASSNNASNDLIKDLEGLALDQMTPIQALNALNDLKNKLARH